MSPKHGWIINFACLLVLLQITLLVGGCAERNPSTNVVLITIDTLRADHVGCYGYKRDTTPNIDKFAGESVVFKNAFTPMPTTLPAHSSIMTSMYPFEHGVRANGWKLDSGMTTLAEVLKARRYTTAAFTSVSGIGKKQGLAQGFDVLDEEKDFGKGTKKNERLAEHTTSIVIDWLKSQREDNNPYFLWVHYWDPHSDYNPPEPFRSMFPASRETKEVDGTTDSLIDILNKRITPLPADVEYLVSLYDGEIRYTDAHVGRLLEYLESRDDTLIILVADHGESFGENDSWGHAYRLYEENIRIPFIIRPPGGAGAGAVIESQAELTDIMPTILDYLSIRANHEFSGRSLRPVIEAKKVAPGHGLIERQYVSEEFSKKFNVEREILLGIRRWPWKFLMNGAGDVELYDLSVDPGEHNNIAAEQPELVQKFRTETTRNLQEIRETEIPGMDPETKENLKALGYL